VAALAGLRIDILGPLTIRENSGAGLGLTVTVLVRTRREAMTTPATSS
jgi:hypothetical protein